MPRQEEVQLRVSVSEQDGGREVYLQGDSPASDGCVGRASAWKAGAVQAC